MNHADSHSQPTPSGNGSPVTVEVIKDMLLRREQGMKKYGTELKTDNGRDALTDLYQELLDAVNYVKQELMERDAVPEDRATKRELGVLLVALNIHHRELAGEPVDPSFGLAFDGHGCITRDELAALFYKLRDHYRTA
jgi:hypothetical protein